VNETGSSKCGLDASLSPRHGFYIASLEPLGRKKSPVLAKLRWSELDQKKPVSGQ